MTPTRAGSILLTASGGKYWNIAMAARDKKKRPTAGAGSGAERELPPGVKLLRTLEGHTDTVYSVAFDPTGQTLASGSDDNTVKLWEPASGKLLRTLEGHTGSV